MPSLEERAATFAKELQLTLNAVLPGSHRTISLKAESSQRYVIRAEGAAAPSRARIPLFINGERLAELSIAEHLGLDRTNTHLKTLRSDVRVFSVLDRTPLLRLEYQHDMRSAPIAHWQVHAERGAFTHLLTRANQYRPQHALETGREAWRRRQLASAVRDVPHEAVRVLRDLGWSVTPPPNPVADRRSPLTTW